MEFSAAPHSGAAKPLVKTDPEKNASTAQRQVFIDLAKTISGKIRRVQLRAEKNYKAVTEKRPTMSAYKNTLSRLGFLVVLIGAIAIMPKPAAAFTCSDQYNAEHLSCLEQFCNGIRTPQCTQTCNEGLAACLSRC